MLPNPRPILENLRILNNTGNQGAAIYAYTGLTFFLRGSEILHNTVTMGGSPFEIDAIVSLFSSNVEISRTIFANFEYTGVQYSAIAKKFGYEEIFITNSIFSNIPSIGRTFNQNTETLINSIINEVGNGTGACIGTYNLNYHSGWDIPCNNEGNIVANPLFVDIENNNFQLQADSPAIDAGTNYDLDGDGIDDITDYFGLAPDMGAKEFVLHGPEGFVIYPTDTSIILTWNQVQDDNFEYYLLERSTDEEFAEDVVSNELVGNYYEDDSLEYDTEYFYRVSYYGGVEQSYYSEVLSVTLQWLDVAGENLPTVYAIHQNYPNPFNPTTQIKYDLPEGAMVSITIYDIMGRSIKSLVNSNQSAGYRSIQWNATNNQGQPVSAGVYLYTIEAGDFRQTKKMILLK